MNTWQRKNTLNFIRVKQIGLLQTRQVHDDSNNTNLEKLSLSSSGTLSNDENFDNQFGQKYFYNYNALKNCF